MKSCILFETLSKSNMTLDEKHMPTSYNMDENFNKFYKVISPPSNCRLQDDLISGWQKYAFYEILDKDCTLAQTDNRVLSILHLINCTKVDDIVIFRIVKKNKKSGILNIRYYCVQGDKKNLCANIHELNNYLV